MGSAEDDEQAYDDERPAHAVELPAFAISRYPITNAQYRPFVESSGYENEAYWTLQGWAWRQGAEADLSPFDDQGEDFKRRYREYLAQRPAEKRNRPWWWDDPKWGAATRPVVGVSWYETLAYCAWLDEQLRAAQRLPGGAEGAVRLPSEAEWEKAARGAAPRRWPWGDEWQDGLANTEEARLGETSPVGMFPGSASPYEVHDLAGNVWEWTSSRWGKTSSKTPDYAYPYEATDGREEWDGPDLRVVRGGSWISNHRSARCAVRFRLTPDLFSNYFGFRVVVSLAFSEF